MNLRALILHEKARAALRDSPDVVRSALGFALHRLQTGETLGMPLSRPMPSVAPGVSELRIASPDGAYRAFYYLKCEAGILVFHVFKKKAQQTTLFDIKLGRKRLKELLDA